MNKTSTVLTREYLKQEFPLTCSDIYCGVYVNAGWNKIVLKAIETLEWLCKETGYRCSVAQIKEKFGGLRLYVDCEDPHNDYFWTTVHAITNQAENTSLHICEICGKYAHLDKSNYWLVTLCNQHIRERREQNHRRNWQARLHTLQRNEAKRIIKDPYVYYPHSHGHCFK